MMQVPDDHVSADKQVRAATATKQPPAPDVVLGEHGSRTSGQTRSSGLALVISIISALIALASMVVSGLNFYFSSFRPAAAVIAIGPQVLVSSTPQIGGWFSVANTGGQPTTITSAKLYWDAPPNVFDATMTSRNLDEWYYTEKGQRQVSTTTHYSLFSPIPLVAHADTSAILWFTTGARDFKFTSGPHTFRVEAFNGGNCLGKAEFVVTLSDINVRNLDPMTELPIDVQQK